MMLCSAVLGLSVLGSLFSSTFAVTNEQEATAWEACESLLLNNPQRIAGFVRLAFHDCVGGCDGCINRDEPDNNGLPVYIDALEVIWDLQRANLGDMTRGDFWQVCAAVAIEAGHRMSSDNGPAPSIQLSYGRTPCTGSDQSPYSSIMNTFPGGHDGLDSTLTYFTNEFGLTEDETVALLGAHTLGRASTGNSGFNGPWVPNPNSLDNDYYREMLQGWQQVRIESGNYQWIRGNPPRMFLNADICFAKDIQPDTNGRVTGGLNQQTDSRTIDLVRAYADNNQRWLTDFASVFNKMIVNKVSTTLTAATGGVSAETETNQAVTTQESVNVRPPPPPPPKRPGGRKGPRELNEDDRLVMKLLARLLEQDDE